MLECTKLKGYLVKREEIIVSLCKGKSVLHLGCADYPFSEEQYKNGNLLHVKLNKVANELVGVDLNEQGVNFLKSIGCKEVMVGNVEQLANLNLGKQFDIVVAGELLEHLSNPGLFFTGIASIMKDEGVLLVTVPNAHSFKGFIRVLFGRELVHPDHLYYFSPATVAHFCKRYNLRIVNSMYYLSDPGSKYKKVFIYPAELVMKYFTPFVADGLVFTIKKTFYEE